MDPTGDIGKVPHITEARETKRTELSDVVDGARGLDACRHRHTILGDLPTTFIAIPLLALLGLRWLASVGGGAGSLDGGFGGTA
jgi:hypothetical protein